MTAAAETVPPPPPINDLSWKVVAQMYACGTLASAILGIVHYFDAAEPLRGAWVIFAPFCPSLLYALWRHRQQRAVKCKES